MAGLDDLLHTVPQWTEPNGNTSGIVLSSRARLARNLTALPFVHRTKKSDLARIVHKVETAVHSSASMEESFYISMPDTPELDRQFLVERRLISPALAKEKNVCGAFIHPLETLTVMVNEEDHIRIQAIQGGLRLEAAWREADRVDTELSRTLDFAFSEDFGYLTTCPTNVGTGIRMSVLIHLPGLVWTNNLDPLIRGLAETGLAVRGFWGEGTEAAGNLYQLSNQRTLGYSEEDIVANFDRVVRQLIAYEQRAYDALLREAPTHTEDRVWRAYGLLAHARILTAQDAIDAISSVRMGVSMGVLNTVDLSTLNRLSILIQSAHVQKIAGRTLDAEERDIFRADLVRQFIHPSSSTSIRRTQDRPN